MVGFFSRTGVGDAVLDITSRVRWLTKVTISE